MVNFSGLGTDATLTRIVLWQTIGQLLGAGLNPYWRALEYKVNARTPNAVLSPADLASAVVRGFMDAGSAQSQAQESGVDSARFQTLVDLAGLAPAPEQLAEALRRHLIPADAGSGEGVGFIQGIEQGNLANKWADMIKGLSEALPTPVLALTALLKGQTDEATARAFYKEFGGMDVNPATGEDYFALAFHTEGEGPSPVEAGVLARRGIIPWDGEGPEITSFHQAFKESQYRNKWEAGFRALSVYLPPPRTITALLREGVITDEQAATLFQDAGLSAELAAAYVTSAHHQKTAAAKTLGVSTIEQLYEDRYITRDQASTFLQGAGYSADDANYMLEVRDLSVHERALRSVVTKLQTLYVSRKIDAAAVSADLTTLGFQAAQVTDLTSLWDIERTANVRELTASQVEQALHWGVIDQATAQARLEAMGYHPHDAWLALSVHEHQALPNEPAP